jgi:hypothetical protein
MIATLGIIGLSILGLIVLIGIIRIIFKPSDSFGDLLMDLFLLDWLGDIFVSILENIGDLFDND